MKIGLYGGAFDPVHKGHIAVAKGAGNYGLDRVIFIPTGNMPHKKRCRATDEQRLKMLSLALEDGFEVSDYEIKRKDVSYSADTIEYMKGIYPTDELYFIVGDDSYGYIDKWKDPERIFKNAKLLVYPREGIKVLPPAIELKCGRVEVSSSEIREKIKRGEDVSRLLTKAVYEYITANGIYH